MRAQVLQDQELIGSRVMGLHGRFEVSGSAVADDAEVHAFSWANPPDAIKARIQRLLGSFDEVR